MQIITLDCIDTSIGDCTLAVVLPIGTAALSSWEMKRQASGPKNLARESTAWLVSFANILSGCFFAKIILRPYQLHREGLDMPFPFCGCLAPGKHLEVET